MAVIVLMKEFAKIGSITAGEFVHVSSGSLIARVASVPVFDKPRDFLEGAQNSGHPRFGSGSDGELAGDVDVAGGRVHGGGISGP
jgi:hypothetical protein